MTAELERRLGGHVVYQEIERIDLVYDHLTVGVRLRPGPAPSAQESVEDAATTGTRPTGVAAEPGGDEVVPKVLLVIEQNLLAEAPELAELFGRLQNRGVTYAPRKVLLLLAAILLLLGVVLLEV